MKDTRQRILGAATQAFAELGYTAASVREITGRVGASPNAINFNFGSKEQLYQEIAQNYRVVLDAPVRELLESDTE